MRKNDGIQILGGTLRAAADAIGVSPQAVGDWPDPLPRRISDRVLAAWARKNVPDLPEIFRPGSDDCVTGGATRSTEGACHV